MIAENDPTRAQEILQKCAHSPESRYCTALAISKEPACKAFRVLRTLQQEGRTSQRPGRFFQHLRRN